MVEQGNALIVDVREPSEWDEGHIEGALHVPLMTIPQRAKDLPKDRPLILQCHSGYRSLQAAMFLRMQGFEDVHNLETGIAGWEEEGLPVVRA